MAFKQAQHIQAYIPQSMETLASRLRSKRRKLGLTQEELGLMTGTNQAVIQKIENGKSLRPRKIDEIAHVLNVSPSWLLYGEAANATLDQESRAVAQAWQQLPEPIRTQIKLKILEQLLSHKAMD